MVGYTVRVNSKKEVKHKTKEGNKTSSNRTYERRLETLNDARNNIVRLVKSNPDMLTFITLTYKIESNCIDSKKHLNTFFTKLRKKYGGIKYIWVLEYGDINHRLHFHVLCNLELGIKHSGLGVKKSEEHKRIEKEFSYKYWKHGFVDIRNLEAEGNDNVGLYISSYIVKALKDVDLQGYRVYGYSHKTLNKPITTKIYTNDSIESILKQFIDSYDIKYQNSYEIGYSNYKGEYKGNVIYFDLCKKEID